MTQSSHETVGVPLAARIALAVVTRDRPESLSRFLLPAVRDMVSAGFGVLVVDQSSGPETEQLINAIYGVEYVRSGTGLSRGRNVAVGATATPLPLSRTTT